MLIDHLVYGTPALEPTVDDLSRRLGVRPSAGGRHTGRGTHNALASLGPRTYLEVIAPDPDQPQAGGPMPFGLEHVVAPRLVGWAVACDDIAAAVARARHRGYDPGDAVDMERVDPAGRTLTWRLTLNAIDGSAVPFLIAWGDTPHPAVTAPQGLTLEGFRIEHPDPDGLVAVLEALELDVDVRAAAAQALVARLRGPDGTTELR